MHWACVALQILRTLHIHSYVQGSLYVATPHLGQLPGSALQPVMWPFWLRAKQLSSSNQMSLTRCLQPQNPWCLPPNKRLGTKPPATKTHFQILGSLGGAIRTRGTSPITSCLISEGSVSYVTPQRNEFNICWKKKCWWSQILISSDQKRMVRSKCYSQRWNFS